MIKKFLHFLLPYRCVLCDSESDTEMNLCQGCCDDLPWLDETCQRCAKPLGADLTCGLTCGECQQNPPHFDRAISLFHYRAPLDKLLRGIKFNQRLIYARLLGKLLAARVDGLTEKPDCIIPVPLHKKRLRQRGFNQAIEIARPVAKRLGIPLNVNTCQRIKATAAQAQIKAKRRSANLRGAFKTNHPLNAKHIAIIDDVITTASTVNELSRTLRKAGAQHIEVWSIARTSRKN